MPERITVFGGEGNMGKVVVDEARRQGHEVFVVDPKAQVQTDPIKAIENSSVVYLSLYPKDLLSTLELHGQQIKPGQIVLDNCSVKTPIIPALNEMDQRGISVTSTHPLAKHDQPTRGVKVLIMPVGSNSQRSADFATSFHKNSGMIVINHELTNHDKIMAPEQGLPHVLWRTLATTLGKQNLDPKELWQLAPANAELLWLAAWRTWIQDPKISASIITNFVASQTGRALLDTFIEDLQELISIADDEAKLQRCFSEALEIINQNGMKEEMNKTTTIVLERLANLRMGSMVILAVKDEPGILHQITGVFMESGVNLTAMDSHTQGDGVKFMIGNDKSTSEEALNQVKIRLSEQGFKVEQINRIE